ncbi:MAG: hypothetical protein J6C64_13970 [Lachnospiraceae bacterium]|nr:hypothetical protein [Lachnospiraceae bacterium]
MKPEMILKICVDTGMTIALLLLMTYELIGQAAHGRSGFLPWRLRFTEPVLL